MCIYGDLVSAQSTTSTTSRLTLLCSSEDSTGRTRGRRARWCLSTYAAAPAPPGRASGPKTALQKQFSKSGVRRAQCTMSKYRVPVLEGSPKQASGLPDLHISLLRWILTFQGSRWKTRDWGHVFTSRAEAHGPWLDTWTRSKHRPYPGYRGSVPATPTHIQGSA